jgi:putative SOS response-associated peptidase YedK
MCGRFTLRTSAQEVAKTFGLVEVPDLRPRFNVAPTQQVLTITLRDVKRQAIFRQWGLVPSWADDPKIGYRMTNARAETVAAKPAFRSAFKRSRCLVVADGFYEWKKAGKAKQPFYIRFTKDRPFAFAGLAEHWSRNDETIESCTFFTTDPNELMAEIHDLRHPMTLPRIPWQLMRLRRNARSPTDCDRGARGQRCHSKSGQNQARRLGNRRKCYVGRASRRHTSI